MTGGAYPNAVSLLMAKGEATLIEADDFAAVSPLRWFSIAYGYATSTPRKQPPPRSPIYLHRLLLNAPKGSHIDHINDDKLDNRRSNLRICTASQNVANGRKAAGKSSRFKGVAFHKKHRLWRAYIQVNKKPHYLGWFKDEVAAAAAYNEAAIRYFGEFARLNCITGDKFEMTEDAIKQKVAELEAEKGRRR